MADSGNMDFPARLKGFFAELKRRKVYRVSVVYVIGAIAGLQLIDVLVPASRLPDWSDEMFLGLAIFGFPLVVIIAWAFEMTPEGVRLTPPTEITRATGKSWTMTALGLILLAAVAAWLYLTGENRSGPEPQASSLPDSTSAPGAVAVTAHVDRPFVAVLPLENLSPDEENAYFAAGVHEEILSQLSKVSGLGVFARTTMNQYRATDLSISQIGEELGAAAVLEGSVRRAGDRVRITAQLIDPRSQDHLWAETFDRRIDDVFAVQEEIARQVASSLEATLSPHEDARMAARPTDSLAAYDLYLRGREALHQFTRESNLDAERLFREALDIDADYALAWAGLGWTFAQRDGRLGYPHGPPAEQAIEYANRAIGIDPLLAEAHEAVGDAQYKLGHREEALAAYLEALDYDPNNVGAAAGAAQIYYSIGRFDQSVRYAKRAARLAPTQINRLNLVSHVYKFLRMDDEAMQWLDKQLTLDASHYWPRLLQAQYDTYRGDCASAMRRVESLIKDSPEIAYAWTGAAAHAYMCGHFSQAIEWARKSLELAPDNIAGYWHETPNLLALALKYADNTSAGEEVLAQALASMEHRAATGERSWGLLWDLAALQAANGDTELAIDTMEQAYQEGFRFVRWPPFEKAFDIIRDNARYVRLMQQMEGDVTEMREQVIREEQG